MSRAIPNSEPALARPMNQMRRRAQVPSESRIFLDCLKRLWCSAISVFTNQLVDRAVFTKLMNAGSQNNQLRPVGQSHASAIDTLVPQPGAAKLMRIKKHH